MESYEVEAEIVDNNSHHVISDPYMAEQALQPGYEDQNYPQEQDNGLFSANNDLKVIQEYNREENMPSQVKQKFWALASKSIKLGFWDKEDFEILFLHNNIINMGEIMSKPRHGYTFENMQDANQMDLMLFADFKRGIGMEKYRINERTLQATSVTQSIQGGGAGNRKRGGVMSGIKSFFG